MQCGNNSSNKDNVNNNSISGNSNDTNSSKACDSVYGAVVLPKSYCIQS